MDKNLYNFSVTWDNQKGQYLGRCAEFYFLSYLADTDLEAYQGILHLVCDFEEQIEKYRHKEELGKWFAANVQNAADDTRPTIPHKKVLDEISTFAEMRVDFNSLKLALREKRLPLTTQ